MTWSEFKEAIEGKGVTGRDVITGFRWFNDQHSKYYVAVWFEGERDDEKRKGICQRPPIESHSGAPIWSQCGGVTGFRT